MKTLRSGLRIRQTISQLGVTDRLSPQEAKRVSVSNWVLLSSFLITLTHVLTYLEQGLWMSFCVQIATNTAFLIALWLNKCQKYIAAD